MSGRGKHSHRCLSCGEGVYCYKSACAQPQKLDRCSWCARAAGAVPAVVLPGFEHVAADRAEAAAEAQGESLTLRMREPRRSISAAAGAMEVHSPLFCDSSANPQQNLFSNPERK
jgi:hypothetical protein